MKDPGRDGHLPHFATRGLSRFQHRLQSKPLKAHQRHRRCAPLTCDAVLQMLDRQPLLCRATNTRRGITLETEVVSISPAVATNNKAGNGYDHCIAMRVQLDLVSCKEATRRPSALRHDMLAISRAQHALGSTEEAHCSRKLLRPALQLRPRRQA